MKHVLDKVFTLRVEILWCWRVADPLIYRRKYRIS